PSELTHDPRSDVDRRPGARGAGASDRVPDVQEEPMSTVPNPNPSPPPVPTAGWATPEHFQAAVKQLLTLLVTLGILQTSDAGNLQSQLAACITAAFIFALNA